MRSRRAMPRRWSGGRRRAMTVRRGAGRAAGPTAASRAATGLPATGHAGRADRAAGPAAARGGLAAREADRAAPVGARESPRASRS